MKKRRGHSVPKQRKRTRAIQTVLNRSRQPKGKLKGLILVEILLPTGAQDQQDLPTFPARTLAPYQRPGYDYGPNTSGLNTGHKVCGSCFVMKGLSVRSDHAEDCLINVPPEYQHRWRQGRDDVISLFEIGKAPVDEGNDSYYQMGRTCTHRNIKVILRFRNSKLALTNRPFED